jgi:HK97 family phage prohead protease
MQRAYSTLVVKASSDDQRTFEGIASTPELDSQGDVVEPRGAQFALPLPLLWQHDAKSPIGNVTHAHVTDEGIHVKARITHVPEPGKLKDRLDEAWLSVKHGLVRGLSIGFVSLDAEPLRGSRGKHIKQWAWRELSCVTMAANATCNVLAVKRADHAVMQRLGMVAPPPLSHADNDMRISDLVKQLGTDKFVVEKRGDALVVELLDKAKSLVPQASAADRKYFEAVMLQFAEGLAKRQTAQRNVLDYRLKELERKLRLLTGE